VRSLDSDQQQSLLIKLLQEWGGVRCMMQKRENDDHYDPLQSGVSVEMQANGESC